MWFNVITTELSTNKTTDRLSTVEALNQLTKKNLVWLQRGSSQTLVAALSSPRQLQASKNAYDLRIHMQTYLQAWSTDS